MVDIEILSQASTPFGIDKETLEFIGNSCNEVYKCSWGNKTYFLRLSDKPLEFEDCIKAEAHFVRYLADNGVRVSIPIHTLDGELTTVCRNHEKTYIATVFEGAPGKLFDSDPELWGPSLFQTWGETMGAMHRLTKSYDSSALKTKRDNWIPTEINNQHLHQGNYHLLVSKLRGLENEMKSLPKERDTYGLIHYDFHPYNFLINEGEITVFDFDDSLYSWFALDIGIAATHAVWWGSQIKEWKSKNEFAKHFLHEFLKGYIKQNHIENEWDQRIPMFMEYRNISSFFWWLIGWDGNEDNLNEFQKNAIKEAVNLIERNLPFDGCNIKL
ncbi:phosphotransferase enzyme family protein [Paenibacillus sp. Marseille-Q7038]